MINKRILNEVYPNWKSGQGVFGYLVNAFELPFSNEASSLDLVYHGSISGRKIITFMLEEIAPYEITDNQAQLISNMIYTMYGDNWLKLWNALQEQYNPINNYDMKEQMIDDITRFDYGKVITREDNLSTQKTGTDTTTPNLTEKMTHGHTINEDHSIYGLNSVSPSPADKVTTGNTGVDSNTTTGNSTVEYDTKDANTGTQTHTDSGQDMHTHNYTLTRKGNIGVTTSQQLLDSEYEFRKRNFFRDIVFKDIDELLVLQYYGGGSCK